MHRDLSRPAVDAQVRECDVGDGVEIPVIAGDGLVMPNIFAGGAFDRDDAVGAQIVARAAQMGRPWPGLSSADIHEVFIGIVGDASPDSATTTGDPPLFLFIPGLGPLRVYALFDGFRPIARYRIELPQFLPGIRVVSREQTPSRIFTTTGTDDNSAAFDNARCHRDRIRHVEWS